MVPRDEKAEEQEGMGGALYQYYCGDLNFPSMPAELLVAAGDGAIEH